VVTGDRERWLDAGMDGYLSKPIDRQMLYAVVQMASEQKAPAPISLNRDELLERLGGDEQLVQEVVRLFLDDCPRRLADLKAAVEARDAEQIRTTAHALKGAAGNLSAMALFEAARTLERMAHENQLDAADAVWRQLSTEADHVLDALSRFEAPTR
jgi:HPt (histidine-containing phosphotransfer) domain-containing protein